jgi:hypothetical protein
VYHQLLSDHRRLAKKHKQALADLQLAKGTPLVPRSPDSDMPLAFSDIFLVSLFLSCDSDLASCCTQMGPWCS